MKYTMMVVVSFFFLGSACSQKRVEPQQIRSSIDLPLEFEKVEKTDEQWESELDKESFYVLRKAGTERPFTGKYWDNKQYGVYTCKACGLPLFASDTKFKSGTGWPSFYEPLKTAYVREDHDYKIGYRRTEVLCARCDGHLGHVFPDGPKPTGLRYCINSVSLDFVALEKGVKIE